MASAHSTVASPSAARNTGTRSAPSRAGRPPHGSWPRYRSSRPARPSERSAACATRLLPAHRARPARIRLLAAHSHVHSDHSPAWLPLRFTSTHRPRPHAVLASRRCITTAACSCTSCQVVIRLIFTSKMTKTVLTSRTRGLSTHTSSANVRKCQGWSARSPRLG